VESIAEAVDEAFIAGTANIALEGLVVVGCLGRNWRAAGLCEQASSRASIRPQNRLKIGLVVAGRIQYLRKKAQGLQNSSATKMQAGYFGFVFPCLGERYVVPCHSCQRWGRHRSLGEC
jgi:hypothetical protein